MAEIVEAALTSHARPITGRPDVSARDRRDRLEPRHPLHVGFHERRRRLAAARPDLIVMFVLAIALLAGSAPVGAAAAAEIKVLSAGALRPVLPGLAELFQRETGQVVMLAFGTAGAVRQKTAAGEPADVVIATDIGIDELVRQGHVAAGTRTDIARVGMGVAIRQGTPLPDISSTEAFRQALLAARSIVYNDPAIGATSGIHFAGVLERLGIAEAVKDKTVLWPGGYAAEAVATGRADLCVHQISEILPVKGVTLVGPLPRDLQKITTYSAGVLARGAMPDAARAFIAFLARPAFKPTFAEAGLDYRE
jgi:molybdate transport system substrate-binding protein